MHFADRFIHLQAARVGPSAYLKLFQAAKETKEERIKYRHTETSESSCGSVSSSSMTKVKTPSGYLF